MKKIALVASLIVVCALLAGYGIFVSAADKSTGKPAGKETVSGGQNTPSPAKKEGEVNFNITGPNAATVNGKPITKAEFQNEVEQFDRRVQMMGRAANDKEISEMRSHLLDNMIGRELLKQEADRLKMKADPAQTDLQMQTLKTKLGSPEEFQKALSKMNVTEQAIRDQFDSEQVMHKLIEQEVAAKVVLPPGAAREFYDKNPEMFKTPEMVRASHILVKFDEKATPAEKAKALEKIKDVQKKIQGGADFAAIAKEASDCPSKENGGDLDFFERGQMVGAFEESAFSLKTGQMSGIVETEFGYHLIKLTDKKEAGVIPFEEIQPRIEQHLKAEKVSQQMGQYIAKLRSAAKVEVFVK